LFISSFRVREAVLSAPSTSSNLTGGKGLQRLLDRGGLRPHRLGHNLLGRGERSVAGGSSASVYPIRQENINFMRVLGVAVGCENQPLAIRRELREGIEAASEGNGFELRAVAIPRYINIGRAHP